MPEYKSPPKAKKVTQEEAEKLAAKAAEEQAAVDTATEEKSKDIKDLTDEFLDEIDGLLEEQEVLVNYRQQGGE